MIEIILKNNETNKKVFINDKYNYKDIPQDILSVLVSALEKQLTEFEKEKKKMNKFRILPKKYWQTNVLGI